jgi:hypothetical protein
VVGIDAGQLGWREPLDLRVAHLDHGLDVAPVEPVEPSAYSLYVLVRNNEPLCGKIPALS